MIKIDVGCGFARLEGYIRIDRDVRTEPDILADLEHADFLNLATWDFCVSENSVNVIRAHDFLEHIRMFRAIELMTQFHAALKPGGLLDIQVPSTDGRGAFQNPLHVSFWNHNSFLYYTKPDAAREIGFDGLFDAEIITDRITDVGVVHTRAKLRKKGETWT